MRDSETAYIVAVICLGTLAGLLPIAVLFSF